MQDFAVVWVDSADPRQLWAGNLSVSPRRLRLRGANGYTAAVHDVGLEDVEAVRPAGAAERIDGYPSVRLELRTPRTFVVTSLAGSGAVAELLDALTSVLPIA